MFLTCASAKELSSPYVDGRLGILGHLRVSAHLRGCEACSDYFEELSALRCSLRRLSAPRVPARLSASLRVLASRERQIQQENHGSRLEQRFENWRFRWNQLMRPLAIPATGGLLSSLILFGTLVLTMGTSSPVAADAEPLLSYPAPIKAQLIPVELRSREVTLTMTLDGMGQLRKYAVADGTASFAGDSSKMQSTRISLPSLGQALGVAEQFSGDIQISLKPLALRR